MIDDVAEVHQFGHQLRVGDGVDVIAELRMDLEMLDIGDGAGGEIVDDADFVAQGEVPLGEMRPDEASPTRDQHLHRLSSASLE